MEWLEFLECSNSEELTIDLFGAAPQDDHEVAAQADQWTPEEKQFFENAFSRYNNIGSQTFFEYVASELPHKSMEEIKNHYITLLKDVEMENPPKTKDVVVAAAADHDQQHYQVPQEDDSSKKEATLNGTPPQVEKSRPRRQRGIRWTVEEHRLFLLGLNMFGKGDWNQISKYCVVSKTPTQVASHAQKFFSRQNSTTPVERRRPSINDIRTLYFNPRTTTTTHQLNNGRLAYNNNHQGSSSMLSHYPNYTFGGPIFSNNSNGNFGGSNQGEASGGV